LWADNEVLEVLAGNSSQTLLERCSVLPRRLSLSLFFFWGGHTPSPAWIGEQRRERERPGGDAARSRPRISSCSCLVPALSPALSPKHLSLTFLLVPELLFGQTRAQPQQVNGVLGGSVLLSPALPPNKTVKEIEWSFSAGTGAMIQVAEFSRGGFERPDPRDRFGKRLERFNETALRIRALERGDSGVYGARIKLHPALVEDQTFNLSVYGG
ncbi:uncharacterized protein LOC113942301, partial [Corapipo altera]|uniref:uncharacterized protein LOC113942301 n=1 Tax=Corapipo altera TaxID=415028 RepID=UPI000FD6344A